MNKQSNELIDDYKSEDHEPTAAEPSYEFDWNRLFEALGESRDETPAHIEERDYTAMGQALGRIFDFILDVDLDNSNAPRLIGRKVLALAWVMDPRRFEDASIRKLAERLGCSAAWLSTLAADASRKMKVSNRFQSHDWRKH